MADVNFKVATTQYNGKSRRTITGVSNGNPSQITTTPAHGYANGEIVWISGVGGATGVNDASYTVTVVDTTNFTIGVDGAGFGTYTTGGVSAPTVDLTVASFGTPKVCMLVAGWGVTDATIAANAALSFGVCDGTDQFVVAVGADDAQATTNTGRTHRTDLCVSVMQANVDDINFAFAEFITDGLRIRRVAGDTSVEQVQITAVLMNGDDLTGWDIGTLDDLGTGTGALTQTTSIDQDVIITAQCINETLVENAQAALSLGMWISDGADTQRNIALGDQDNLGTSLTNGYVSDQHGSSRVFADANAYNVLIDNATTTTFDFTPTASATNDIISWLALEFTAGHGVDLFNMQWPTVSPYAETSPGFTPGFGLIASIVGPSTRNTTHSGDIGHNLVLFDDTTIASYTYASADNDGGGSNSVAKSYYADSLSILDGDGSTVSVAGTFDGFDASGWDWTLSTTPSSNVLGFGFAIEEAVTDVTAPNLSLPTSVTTFPTEATLGATTDEDNGTAHAIIVANGNEALPTNQEVIDDTYGSTLFTLTDKTITATGAFTFDEITGLAPGTTYGLAIVHEDAVGNEDVGSRISTTFTTVAAYAGSATYDGGTIPDTSILYITDGTHTGANNASILTDSTAGWTVDAFIGMEVRNDTDVSLATITDNDATTITGTLSGGTDNDWDANDVYAVQIAADSPDVIYHETIVTVISEATSFDYYIYDDSGASYSENATVNISVPGAGNGTYTVSLDTKGTPTLTPGTIPSASITGTAINVSESFIQGTGGTVIVTLEDETFIAAGTGPIGTTAQSQAFIDALTAATTPTNGWNNNIRDVLIPATHLARTSATVATFTIPATAGYDIDSNEVISLSVPNEILTISTSDLDSLNSFQITAEGIGGGNVEDITSLITSNIVSDIAID